MLDIFAHIPENAVVWANDSRVYEILRTLHVGEEVKLCGIDGWPRECDENTMLVRLINTPPPLPVSTFQRGEIVVSPAQMKMFWAEEEAPSC